MNAKYLSVLTIVAGVLLGIALLSAPNKSVHKEAELGKLFPDFADKMAEVSTVNIRSASGEINVQQLDKKWVLTEKDSYPIQVEKIKALLLALSDLEKIEAATSKAELYTRVNVEDVTAKEAKSVQVTAKNASGQSLLSIIIGMSKPAKGDSTRREIFVRIPDDKQSWRVLGALSIDRTAIDWLDTILVDDNADDIQAVDIKNAAESIQFAKPAKGSEFELAALPVGATLKKEANLNLIAALTSNLTFDDVLKAEKVDFNATPIQATFKRFDGVNIEMTVVKKEKLYYAKFAASFTAPAKETKTDAKPEELKAAEEAIKKSQEFVETFNAKVKGWAYAVPDYKMQRLEIKHADLYEVKAPESVKEAADALLNTAPAESSSSSSNASSAPVEDALANPATN